MKKIYSLILLLVFPLLLQAQYKIRTILGDGNTAISNQSIGGSTSIAKDDQGNFYLATAGSHVILKISTSQVKTVFAGNGTAGFGGDNGLASAAILNAPSSVSVQGNDLYIADQGNRRIRKINLNTNIITTVAGNGTEEITGNGLGGCVAVAVDNQLNIYVSTGSKNTIKKITPTGVHSTFAGTGTAGYDANQTTATASPLYAPAALLIKNNNLYIADMGNRRIRMINLTTNLIRTVAGDGTTNIIGNGLGGCNGVAVDDQNNIYVSTGGKNVIRKITPAGVHTTIAGTGVAGFSGDGSTATSALLKGPSGLLYSNAQLYVTDLGNYRVRSLINLNFQPNSSRVLFVKKGSTGTGDSWNNAVGELADALEWAKDRAVDTPWTLQNPLQIWVAAGTYVPQYKLANLDSNNNPTTTRDQTFLIPNNVYLYGGFAGNEALETDRIWNANTTVLSGDLTGNDLANSFDNHIENAYHVVCAIEVNTTLDGFTISGGSTSTQGSVLFNQKHIFKTSGAGIASYNSTVKLFNITLEKNRATAAAAAYINQSILTFKNSIARNNLATNMTCFSISNISTVNILNSAFYNNTATNLYAVLINNQSSTTITNSVFTKNSSQTISPLQGTMITDPSPVKIYNSIIWDNRTGPGSFSTTYFTVANNILPQLLTNNWDTDPEFTDAANGDFSLKITSPARNRGQNSLYTASGGNLANDKDLAHQSRLTDTHIDLGPYEIQVPLPPLTVVLTETHIDCFGRNTGAISAAVTGGTPPYSYQWIDALNTQSNRSNLPTGTYTLTVTDSNGTVITASSTLTQPNALSIAESKTSVSCNGGTNGSASVTVSGGTPPYTYLWAPTGGTAASASGLTAGEYEVTIKDAKGCTTTQTIVISQPQPLQITSSQTNIGCNGGDYGSAEVQVLGGTPPYSYTWSSNSGTNNRATNLAAGNYTVIVTDAKGCSTSHVINIINDALTTTWDGNSWSHGVPNSLVYRAIFKGDFVSTTNLKACSVSIENNARVSIQGGTNLTVNHSINIEAGADLIIEDQANLIQLENDQNSGLATVISKSSPMKWLDYTIWSSPVSSQNVFAFSPETVTSRIFTYKGALETVNQSPLNNTPLSHTSIMEVGYGYFFRAPNTYHSLLPNSAVYEGKFYGVLNNGSIVVNTYSDNFTSIGNPYPSALNLSNVVTDHDATLYFYTNSYDYVDGAYTGNNYASYNNTGATASGNGVIPTAIVQKGQGFVIETPSSTLEFNNAMRVSTSGDLMRNTVVERHRYWIDLKETESNKLYNQILIGYLEGATSGFDQGKDAKLFGHDGTALYSLITADETPYVIQGKGLPFADTDRVTLGFKASKAGTFTIKLSHRDGLFTQSQSVILKDKLLNTQQDLTANNYVFTSEDGVFNTRFEIVYKSQQLSTEQPNDLRDWLVYKKDEVFQIHSTGFDIQHVEVFDMLGKRLFKSAPIGTNTYQLPAFKDQQILIIKLQTMGNQTFYKKVKN